MIHRDTQSQPSLGRSNLRSKIPRSKIPRSQDPAWNLRSSLRNLRSNLRNLRFKFWREIFRLVFWEICPARGSWKCKWVYFIFISLAWSSFQFQCCKIKPYEWSFIEDILEINTFFDIETSTMNVLMQGLGCWRDLSGRQWTATNASQTFQNQNLLFMNRPWSFSFHYTRLLFQFLFVSPRQDLFPPNNMNDSMLG